MSAKHPILFAQQLSSANGRGQYETAIGRRELTEYVGTLETIQIFGPPRRHVKFEIMGRRRFQPKETIHDPYVIVSYT